MLFLVVLGAVMTLQINSGILFMGVAILIGYVYRFAHLTKRQIAVSVFLAIMIGLIATILPYFLVSQIKPKLIVLGIGV